MVTVEQPEHRSSPQALQVSSKNSINNLSCTFRVITAHVPKFSLIVPPFFVHFQPQLKACMPGIKDMFFLFASIGTRFEHLLSAPPRPFPPFSTSPDPEARVVPGAPARLPGSLPGGAAARGGDRLPGHPRLRRHKGPGPRPGGWGQDGVVECVSGHPRCGPLRTLLWTLPMDGVMVPPRRSLAQPSTSFCCRWLHLYSFEGRLWSPWSGVGS